MTFSKICLAGSLMLSLLISGCATQPSVIGEVVSPEGLLPAPSTLATTLQANESFGADLLSLEAPVLIFEAVLSTEEGMASWYGPRFHGRKTANGERFNMHELTAAHRKLPFNSMARVTCLSTGEQVVVRINDRGPYSNNRALDLSKAAATKLGMLGKGLTRVKIEVLASNSPY